MSRGNRGIRLSLLVACAAALAVFVVLPALASGDPGEISAKGKVTDGGGNGLKGIEVCLDATAAGVFTSCVDTNAAGEWQLESLDPGTYVADFSVAQSGLFYAPRYWQGAKRRADATLITIKAGQTATINEALTEMGGFITGTVRLAADGSPIEGAPVCAISSEFGLDCADSDVNGDYLLYGLPAEDQVVRFSGYNGTLETQYYNHRLFKVQATELKVESGQAISGINADMRVGGRISGHIYSPDGLPLPEIEACAIGVDTPEPVAHCEFSKVGGAYTVSGLSPGTYKVGFSLAASDGVAGLNFEFSEDDGWPSQFWNLRRTLALGETITLAPDQTVAGIDAKLGVFVDPPPVAPPVAAAPAPAKPKPLKCKKNQRKVTVKKKGKAPVKRCVKKKSKKHKKHKHGKR